ncbi:MAG TPA: DUF3090 family protein [Acidimicrobiales bacterium]|nr:DUF3090 family protein [Acidimicrobiales bacterium]
MNPSFDLPSVDALTFGTVGEPGKRVFFVQAWAATTVVTLKAEKQQVAGLAAAMQELLVDLPSESSPTAAPGLRTPIEQDWVIGAIGLSTFDEATQRVTILFEEAVRPADDAGEDAEPVAGATARIGVTIAQMVALVARGVELVAGGRPNCPLCGNPMDPDGHSCPKTNGHLKH